jgi:hypothetical protein
MVPILSQMKPIHTVPPYLHEMQLHIIRPLNAQVYCHDGRTNAEHFDSKIALSEYAGNSSNRKADKGSAFPVAFISCNLS